MFISNYIKENMKDCNLFDETILNKYIDYRKQILKLLNLRKSTLLINNR